MLLNSFLLATLFAAASIAAPTSACPPRATIDSGVVIGKKTSLPDSDKAVNQFLGIPFAAPPVRFTPPTKPEPWSRPFNATEYGPSCIQQFNYPEESRNRSIAWYNDPPTPAGESEDCLNLNVYVPAEPAENRTVMVWFYGGANNFGRNSDLLYDGTSFAANQDVIIVVFNYRLNVFGFPGSPELDLGDRNLGFLDQRLAVDWVQRNIAAFGGDPEKVTLFGESAGADGIDALITSIPEDPPFRAAILQSAPIFIPSTVNTSVARPGWALLAEAFNCSETHPESNLTCLQSQPAELIKSTIELFSLPFSPISDGVTSVVSRTEARLNGSFAQIPVLAGSNADEGTIFTLGLNNSKQLLSVIFPEAPELLEPFLDIYPEDPENPNAQVDGFIRDLVYQCPMLILTNMTQAAGIPSYRFVFNASFENTEFFPGAGAAHVSEIPIVWGTSPQENITDDQIALSLAMQTAWADFAKDPTSGPGFDSVPNVAVYGSGVGLHGDGSGRLLDELPSSIIDARCTLLAQIFELIEG
ncbi:hypothetical protein B0A52_07995 [Exophiala mesophila]|uniref:Carboxylic ester hydrolase n=1 Tax=Exophiala mesophila TaxID=212818 RepID=A0A438MXU4_EXOME|nr:hypothetical protein B0A52_07995 [Exophiala mesophila]